MARLGEIGQRLAGAWRHRPRRFPDQLLNTEKAEDHGAPRESVVRRQSGAFQWRSVVLGLLRVERLRNREAGRCLSLRQPLPELGDEPARISVERLPDDAGGTGMAGPFIQ